jgi:pimeloyl-ACP methyl ester carboxylesterase
MRGVSLLGFTGTIALFFLSPAVAEQATDNISRRPDGSSIYWHLDRRAGDGKQGILLIAQGSGGLAATENPNITKAKHLLPDFAVMTVEKYGVAPHAAPKDPYEGCSVSFYAHHTVSQRVADCERILAELGRQPWWNGKLILFGGSEGGAVVSLLAPKVKPTAVVVFSTAPGRSFAEIFKRTVPPEVAQHFDEELTKIRENPTGPNVWGGNSYRWWTDILHQDMTAALLTTRSPILLVQGDRDKNAPVAVARGVRDEFQHAGLSNLTYWELTGYDHAMQDPAGASHLDDVMMRISAWLRDKASKADSPK